MNSKEILELRMDGDEVGSFHECFNELQRLESQLKASYSKDEMIKILDWSLGLFLPSQAEYALNQYEYYKSKNTKES